MKRQQNENQNIKYVITHFSSDNDKDIALVLRAFPSGNAVGSRVFLACGRSVVRMPVATLLTRLIWL